MITFRFMDGCEAGEQYSNVSALTRIVIIPVQHNDKLAFGSIISQGLNERREELNTVKLL